MEKLRFIIISLLTLIVVGCGGNSDGGSSAVVPTSGNSPTVATGTLRIQSVLARSVPTQVTDFKVTGFDLNGVAVFGPEQVSKSAQVEFTVPVTVTRIQVEYLASGTIIGIGFTDVTIVAGQMTELNNLDFQDVAAALTALAITPNSSSLAKGTSVTLTAQGTFADGSQSDLSSSVTWSSNDTNVATVSSTGQLTALNEGTASVQADFGGVTVNTTITVTPATVVSLSVSPIVQSLAVGTTSQLIATASFSDGTQQDVSSLATWVSNNPGLATVNTSGLASAVSAGEAVIEASFSGRAAEATIVITSGTLSSIVITPANPSLAAGTATQLTATGVFSDSTTQNITSSVTWSSDNTATATVSPSGQAAGVAAGSTIIRASFGSLSAQTNLNVTNAVVNSVVVNPASGAIALGTDQQFTATANFSDGTQQDVTATATWSSSDTGVGTVNNAGLANAAGQGQTSVEASFSGFSSQASLTVDAATVTGLAITPTLPTIANGTTQQFTAIAQFSDGTQQNVTSRTAWTSSSTSVAGVAPDGLATAATPGNTNIQAQFGGQSASTQLTVSAAVINSITVNPKSPAIGIGTTQQFTATANLSDGTNQDMTSSVSWVSGDTAAATIDNAGLASAVSAGQSVIKATSGSISGTATLTVTPATVTSMSVSPASPSLAAGLQQQMVATAFFSDGSSQDVSSRAAWVSSSTGTASISSIGRVTALTAGSSSISATFDGQSDSTTLTVTSALLTEVLVTPEASILANGTSAQLTATAVFSDGTMQNVTGLATWNSSATFIGTVNTSGLVSSASLGETTISALFNGQSGSAKVTVISPAVTALTLTPTNPSQPVGRNQQFTATADFTDGVTQDVTTSAVWGSDTPSVASVSVSGEASALSIGSSQISASFGGTTANTSFTATAATIDSITVTPNNDVINSGTTLQLTATANFTDGSTQDVTSSATWSSLAPSVASVDNTGLVTGVGNGQARIRVDLGRIGSLILVNVQAPDAVLIGVRVEPPIAYCAPGSSIQYKATALYDDGTEVDVTSTARWSQSASVVQVGNDNNGRNRNGQARVVEGAPIGTTVFVSAGFGRFTQLATLSVRHYLLASRQFLDTVDSYSVNADGTLTAANLGMNVPNAPEQMVLSPSGRFLYLSHPDSSLLSVNRLEFDGSLTSVESLSTLPFARVPKISADGRFLYLIDRQTNSGVTRYSIATDGTLTLRETTTISGFNFADILEVDPQGRVVFLAGGSGIAVFDVNSNGSLTHRETITGFTVSLDLDSTGDNLYAGNNITGGSVSAYAISADGTITANGITDTNNVGADRLVVDGQDRFVYVLHSDTADVTAYQIDFDGSLSALGLVSNDPTGLNSPEVLAATRSKAAFYHGDAGSGGLITFQIQPDGQVTALAPLGSGSATKGLVLTP